jgi:hypothetical protein
MSSESTGWPLLDERAPLARPARRTRRRPRPRSAWVLTVLAFLCGGLVSAAGFSIGWRHQAQQGSRAEAQLATATARNHRLQASLTAARREAVQAANAKAAAVAASRALSSAAAAVATEASAGGRTASAVSGDAGVLSSSASRIANELKTLDTYLTTTPAGQLDSGYIASQTAYLTRQLADLETAGAGLGHAMSGFETAARKLGRAAAALSSHR